MYLGTQAIFSYDELYKLDIANCWPLSHIWYAVVFYLVYLLFKKILIDYQHLKIGRIHIRIHIFSSFEKKKKESGSIRLVFLQVVSWRELSPNCLLEVGCVFFPLPSSHHSLLLPNCLVSFSNFCYLASPVGLLSLRCF